MTKGGQSTEKDSSCFNIIKFRIKMCSTTTGSANQENNQKLVEACEKQDLSLVKKLISEGAQANFVHKKDGTWGAYEKYSVLHVAINSLPTDENTTSKQKEDWREIIKVLLKNGANPNETKASYDWRGCGSENTTFELLCYQTERPDPDLLSSFLESGLNPDLAQVQDIHSMRTDGQIKTHMLPDFAGSGNIECVISLLNSGANIEIRDTESITNERGYQEEKSKTALHVAASGNQIEICILLLAKGADINAVEYHLDSVMDEDIVKQNTTDDPRDETYKNPWKITPIECTSIHLAIGNENFDLAKFLLICGADTSIPYKKGDTNIKTEDWHKLEASKPKTLAEKTNSELLHQALINNLDMNDSIVSMPLDFKIKIEKTFDRIQELGWNFDTCHFQEISNALKHS